MKRSLFLVFLIHFLKICKADVGEPVFLTPLIQDEKIEEAQQMAKVNNTPFDAVESYSGFLTVNPEFNSNLFFWYFPAAENPETAPVVLWLQGGPGWSSLIGLFMENGPFYIQDDKFNLREYSWHLNHHLIYIDSPVGTGFSFTKDQNGYATDQNMVSKDLYDALLQFYTLFPNLQRNDFYAAGESYGGKYVPALCHKIHNSNKVADLKINLKGFAIGNGLVDPINQHSHGQYLYTLGMIDWKQKSRLDEMAVQTKAAILAGDFLNGSFNMDYERAEYKKYTGMISDFNYLSSSADLTVTRMAGIVEKKYVRKALHVGNLTFRTDYEVAEILREDISKSVAELVGELLSFYKGFFYNGQLDVVCAYPLQVAFLNELQFSGAKEYREASRHQWVLDEKVVGYVKEAGNLTDILVKNAGHMVPTDQPKVALEMLNKLTSNKPFIY